MLIFVLLIFDDERQLMLFLVNKNVGFANQFLVYEIRIELNI